MLALLPFLSLSLSEYSLPKNEYNALYDLFNSTNGKDWKWRLPFSAANGYEWRFVTPPENPCSPTHPWQGVTCTSTCGSDSCNILQLELFDHNLNGSLPSSMGDLVSLSKLHLNSNQLIGTIPESLGNLSAITDLYLGKNQLTGTVPASLGNLRVLEELYLFKNQLTGMIPESLANLGSSLLYLDLDTNQLTGTIPAALGSLNSLLFLDLDTNQLTGTIPPSLGYLSTLQQLVLYRNQLTGTIPTLLGNWSALVSFDLFQNQLTGTIPESLGNLRVLHYLSLYENQLTGTIPAAFGNLSALKILYLSQNQLTGTIPHELGNMSSLVSLDLDQNLVTGAIPASLGNLSTLKFLELYQNQLTGTIPASLGNLQSLLYLYLNQNQLTATIPASLGNLETLQYLFLYENQLSGMIPASLGNLSELVYLFLNGNQLTGTIPASLGKLRNLKYFVTYTNYLTGTVPSEIGGLNKLIYLFLSSNLLSGNIPSELSECVDLQTVYLFRNVITGTIPVSWSQLKHLSDIDLSQNQLSGSIGDGLFNGLLNLTSIVLSENAFTGKLPSSMFKAPQLLTVVLAKNCFSTFLPDEVCTSFPLTQLILDGLHSAPSCSDKAIPGLSSSGLIAKNSVHGHIPSCLLQHKHLSVLHLGGNSFSGSIPNVPISAALTELVLSSNQLTGSIPDSIWQSNITKLDLSLNRLQGTLPSNMLQTAQAQLQLQQQVESTSNVTVSVKLQVNQLAGTIPGWLQSLPSGNIDVLEGNLFSCNAERSDLPVNDPKAETYECGSDNTNYGLLAFGTALICVGMSALVYRYVFGTGTASVMLNSFNKYYEGSEVKKLWQHMERVVYVIVGMWMLGMLVFGLLSLQDSSYAEVYVWVVSAIFKKGFSSALLIMFWLMSSLAVTLMHRGINFAYTDRKLRTASHQVRFSNWRPSFGVMNLTVILLLVIDMSIVLLVNGLYVYLQISGDYSYKFLLFVAVLLSMFKLLWNIALWRTNKYVPTITDTSLLLIALFNNLLAPLLAEMFVSSDCFLYIVTQAPLLSFRYTEYFCQLEEGKEGFIHQVCSIPVLIEQGYGTTEDVSITPLFHYSYQCSFSLISSYSYVFISRYILSALVEPLIKGWLVFHLTTSPSHCIKDILLKALPTFWKNIVFLSNSMQDIEKFSERLIEFEKQIMNGAVRRRTVVLLVTDLTMLICFGALFPPLAVIIGLSVLKDVMSIRLALGRYCEIMEAVQDESLKNQMVKVREYMDEEMLKAGAGIWNGVWYGMVITTWIWGFVLFDTMASVEGVENGVFVMSGMLVSPFIIGSIINLAKSWSTKPTEIAIIDLGKIQRNGHAILTTTMNPVFNNGGSHIEMTDRSLTNLRKSGKRRPIRFGLFVVQISFHLIFTDDQSKKSCNN
jgi:Leucine-rich repeat (LRR) protein